VSPRDPWHLYIDATLILLIVKPFIRLLLGEKASMRRNPLRNNQCQCVYHRAIPDEEAALRCGTRRTGAMEAEIHHRHFGTACVLL
jgi:hypothetical protein